MMHIDFMQLCRDEVKRQTKNRYVVYIDEACKEIYGYRPVSTVEFDELIRCIHKIHDKEDTYLSRSIHYEFNQMSIIAESLETVLSQYDLSTIYDILKALDRQCSIQISREELKTTLRLSGYQLVKQGDNYKILSEDVLTF